MAGPQFITPRVGRPGTPQRRFSLKEANKTLPLVRRIVQDIVRSHAEAIRLQAAQELTSESAKQAAIQSQLEIQTSHLEDYLDELHEVGCEMKDFDSGLIDFVGRHQGRDVCLCWRLDEPVIEYWHETEAGFAGRKPVSMLEEQE
jgi:hypothetical protein